MPYDIQQKNGQYKLKNKKTGEITHVPSAKSKQDAENYARLREAFSHGFKKTNVREHHRKGTKGVKEHNRKIKYKDEPYSVLKRRFGIKAYADDDKDGAPNKNDCRPWDKNKQDYVNNSDFGEYKDLLDETDEEIAKLGDYDNLDDADKKEELTKLLEKRSDIEREAQRKYDEVMG